MIDRVKAFFSPVLALFPIPGRPADQQDDETIVSNLFHSAAMVPINWMLRVTSGMKFVVLDENDSEVASDIPERLNRRRGEVLSLAIRDYCLAGNCFFEILEGGELQYINPSRVTLNVQAYEGTTLRVIQVATGTGMRTLVNAEGAPPEFVHIKHSHDLDREYKGVSPLLPAYPDTMTDKKASETAATVMDNLAVFGPILSTEETVSKDHLEKVVNKAQEVYGGAGAGKTVGFNVPIKITYPELRGIDRIGFDALRNRFEARCCAALGLQPATVGLTTGLESSAVGATQRTFWLQSLNDGVRPMITSIAEQIGDFLLPLEDKDSDAVRLTFDFTELEIRYDPPDAGQDEPEEDNENE